MIQTYLDDPLVKNYTAPKYPLFIALQNALSSFHSKKSMRDPRSDIAAFVNKIGPEGQKFVLSWLMESLQIPDSKDKSNSSHKLNFFTEVLNQYSESQAFLSYFPEVLNKATKPNALAAYLQNLFNTLKPTILCQVVIGLSLYLSDRSQYIQQGQIELSKHLKQLMKANKGRDLSQKVLEQIIFQISRNPELIEKLEEEYNYLLEIAEKSPIPSDIKLYNFLKCDWQYFANETYSNEKPTQPFFKKVDYLKQLGPYTSQQVDNMKNVLSQNGTLSEDDIFQCLVMMTDQNTKPGSGVQRFVTQYLYSNTKKSVAKVQDYRKLLSTQFASKKTNGPWNIDNFINVVNQICPNIKWQNVFALFDRPKLDITSEEQFLCLMKAFEKTKKIGQKWKVPENIYLKKWSNPYSQALFLIQLFSCKEPDYLFLNQIQNRRIQKSVRDCNSLQKQIWGHLDLVQILVQTSDYRFISIRELFENPIAKYPEVLLMTLSEIRPSKGQALLDELFSSLLPQYLQNHSTSLKILDSLWQANQDLVISCICQIYKTESKKQNSFNLSRVLDITQSIKDSLIPFTTWNDYEFSIPLAVIAGKRQFLNFQPWIIDRIEKLSNSFVRAILLYIQNYLLKSMRTITHPSHKQNILEKAQLTIELLNKIFYTIMSKLKREQISHRNFELLKRIFKECCEYFPQITDNQIPDEIERETERQINRIYKEQITITQAIQRMKKLKNSPKQQDQQQFASHITFLCSELSYHHTYPEKQLMITAELFAALINANLIDNKIYAMFLSVLEDGLKEDGPKYMFAFRVINIIKPKISQQNWFCQKLLDNELIMKKNPELVEELVKNMNSARPLPAQKQRKIKQAIKQKNAPPPPQPAISVVMPSEQQVISEELKKVEQSDYEILTNLDLTKKIEMADKETKLSKINLACNTISANNLEQKLKDLKKIIEVDQNSIKLLAYNIVFKRISTTTPNAGIDVMYQLVEKLPTIYKPILNITYKILTEWFNLKGKSVNDKKLSNFKNIGSWLSKLTIAKGIPVPIHKLNLRKILIQTYANSHRLNFNIPVVLKILELINLHPEVFRMTSPWLSRIVGTLSEIQDKLKDEQYSTTKNQIKAFFKSMNMKLQNFPSAQTSFLNLNNTSSNRITIPELDRYIKVDDQLERKYSLLKIDLKMIINRAVDESIQEIVEPVIDRAVKIAKVTTKQLITKDFAFQPDPDRFRDSSYKLVKEMAGPLAQVTCREPLKASMSRSLKTMLSQSISDANEIQSIIQKAVADNLDFGCNLIKQAVVQSAEQVIKKDPVISDAIQLRVMARNQGLPFKMDNSLIQIPSIVPQQLRPRSGGLSPQQYQVYTEFKKQKPTVPIPPTLPQQRSPTQKILDMLSQKSPIKQIKQQLQLSQNQIIKEQILNKLHSYIATYYNDQLQVQYYIDVCQIIKEFVEPKDCWKSFKQINDLKKKQIHKIVRKLVREKYFLEGVLNQLDKCNEEENRVTTLFQSWLETAHEGIQPFLRNLEQMFNKSQNQIKIFFSYSLHYVMQKLSQSYSQLHNSFDTNYIQNYTKLIIISYKTIASNNSSLYLQHTIQAILDVFNKLQNGSNQFSYQRPFFKLFTNLICDVMRKQYDIDAEKILTFYCVLAKELHKINPIVCPSFTCAWFQLICNKNFMPSLLCKYQYWDLYYHLLCSLLKFVREYITQDNLSKKESQPYQSFYLAVLKLIVVILHDFPDFLSQFSLQLALLAGPKFYQLNSVIISAFPKQMKVQAPLKIDKRQQFVAHCKRGGMPKYYKLRFEKNLLNQYLQSDPRDAAFKQKMSREEEETLQMFVLYVSWTSENQLSEVESAKKLTQILVHAKEETRTRLLNCMLNMIRYPNNVTMFFIDFLKDIIFNKSIKDNTIREQLLSSIISRMNSEGPHSWGQLYLTKQIQIHKNELHALNVSPRILDIM